MPPSSIDQAGQKSGSCAILLSTFGPVGGNVSGTFTAQVLNAFGGDAGAPTLSGTFQVPRVN